MRVLGVVCGGYEVGYGVSHVGWGIRYSVVGMRAYWGMW